MTNASSFFLCRNFFFLLVHNPEILENLIKIIVSSEHILMWSIADDINVFFLEVLEHVRHGLCLFSAGVNPFCQPFLLTQGNFAVIKKDWQRSFAH